MATTLSAALPRSADTRGRLIGIGLVLASNLIFGLSNVLVKWSTTQYPVGEAIFIRSVTALALIAPFVRFSHLLNAARGNPGIHLLRMVLTAAELACYYWAITYLQLADTSAFYLSSPIMLTVLSAIILREHVDRARWIAIVIGFIGVLIALHPSQHALAWPALIALGGSCMYAAILTMTRWLRRTPNVVLVALSLASVVIAGALTMPFGWRMPTWPALFALAIVGIVSIVGSILLNRALQLAPASVVAPFQYSSIIWAVLLGYVAFDDIPDLTLIAGATIIIGAGLFILWRERGAGKGKE